MLSYLKTLFLSCLLLSSVCMAYEYDLSICAIFRDDAPYLKEWVDFHKKQGVKRFYLYDNFSKDNPKKELINEIYNKTVVIIPWPVEHKNFDEWRHCQESAYEDCAKRFKKESKWCAFIDTDEFLFCPDGKKIPEFLKEFKGYQQIMVSWMLYGTGGVKECPKGELHKKLLYRTSSDLYHWQKCITRLSKMTSCETCHLMNVKNASKSVNENKRQEYYGYTITPHFEKIRINHYMFRDENYFYNHKLRKMKEQGRTDMQHFIDWEKECNEVFDDTILRYCNSA